MGRWADAPVLGMPGLWRDKGSTAKTWPELRASLLRPHLLVLDDLGASGSTAAAYDRARELLEARFRSSKLTVVTTNVATPDLPKLLGVIHRLVDAGATVVVIEHNPDVMREADWLIDLGPGSGEAGGRVVYQGAYEGVMDAAESRTGAWLRENAPA